MDSLGHGGQAETYRVRREGDDSAYALKVCNSDDQKALTRFRIEVTTAQSLASSGCPNIVAIVDAQVEPAEGRPWFVMPVYEPMWKNRCYLEDYKGNIPRVLEVTEGVANALAFMHDVAGQTHRDVKASNVFFEAPGGSPMLGDFGLAYDPTQAEPVSSVGERLGPYWRAPELGAGSLYQRHPGSDIYALGGLIYEALSGGTWFEETEQMDGRYTHELPQYSLGNITDDVRVPYVNGMLRHMFRRHPDDRISARDFIVLSRGIREWRPGQQPPEAAEATSAAAAEEYVRRSPRLKRERVRQELAEVATRIAERVRGLRRQRNYLVAKVEPNLGDDMPFRRAEADLPNLVWAAVRVMFDFEPPGDRHMLMSYVMIGRDPTAREEVVAVFGADRSWEVVARGPVGTPQHEEAMVEHVRTQFAKLDAEMAALIERLE